MFGFLLLILLIFIFLPLFKIGWQVWSNMRRMRRFMSDPQEYFRRQQQAQGGSAHPQQKARRKAKKIDRDTGEYIGFEEVEVSREERAADRNHTVNYKEESQITDIDWEDIK